ncbi:MAG TPA: DUF5668 domain-containing protein [Terracidiphilus sp.]|jgi:hypothetical protein|nr:DUF5668 domain-containing protein [Terracidiphilus sp.]
MNRYILIRRLTGPAILLLIGVLALLHEAGVVDHWLHLFWPLLLILIGVMKLAERAALASEGYPPYPGVGCCDPNQGYSYPNYSGAQTQPPPTSETSIVRANTDDDMRGGQS